MAKFNARSEANLAFCHPLLQKVLREAIKEYHFIVTDSRRGEIAQTKAFKTGHSKVRFGDSAHNYVPCFATDIYPAPFSQNTPVAEYIKMQQIVLKCAKRLGIKIRQGMDFNMNGNLSDDPWDDLPHVELFPWREYAKKAKLYKGN